MTFPFIRGVSVGHASERRQSLTDPSSRNRLPRSWPHRPYRSGHFNWSDFPRGPPRSAHSILVETTS
jgi:hypothetical protein